MPSRADTPGQYRQWDTSKGPIPEDAGGTARVIPAGGGDAIPLAAGRAGFPAWSPEGHALVYVELPNTLKLLPGAKRPGDGVRLNWAPGKLIAAIDSEPTLPSLTRRP